MTASAPPPGGQTYVERRPAPALAGLVASVWVQQIAADANPYVHRNLPHGGMELVWHLGSTPQILGPATRPASDVLSPGTTVLGLRFRPGAAAAVLGLPTGELVDLSVPAGDLWGSPAVALAEQADDATPDDALLGLQRLVAARMSDAADPDPLVDDAVRLLMPWQAGAVRPLMTSLGISERQLRRRCLASVGLAPKTLHRILRFQGFLALVQSAVARGRTPTDDRLALLSAEAGYADQSHLTRECVRLTGVSPRAFLGDTHRNCACGHDHAASFTPMLEARPPLG
ncbi:MAG TPA: helix-turn-helix domain-containing protein [Jatrophihabitantaceae bacterium]